jgi:hypothetical protein
MNRQGGIDKKSIDSVDETIDSKGTIAKTRAGIDALRENQLWNINTPIIGRSPYRLEKARLRSEDCPVTPCVPARRDRR